MGRSAFNKAAIVFAVAILTVSGCCLQVVGTPPGIGSSSMATDATSAASGSSTGRETAVSSSSGIGTSAAASNSGTATGTGVAGTGTGSGTGSSSSTAGGSSTGGTTTGAKIGCVIDGGFFAPRASNPSNPAECCNPTLSPNAWLPLFSRRFSYPVNFVPAPDGNHIAGVNDGAVADLDGDGRADVVLTAYIETPNETLGQSQAWVYLSRDGGFEGPTVYPGEFPNESWPGAVTVGDLNLDGVPDLIVSTSDSLEVRLGTGNGAFGDEIHIATDQSCEGGYVRVVDANSDGWPDVEDVTWNCGMLAFLNDPSNPGMLQAPTEVAPAQKSGALGVGDFNNDGYVDVAYDQGSSLAWFQNSKTGLDYSSNALAGSGISSILSFATGTGDALAVTSGNSLEVFPPSATGPGNPVTYPLDIGGILAVGDLNGDGLPDLLVGGGETIDVLINLGNGRFTPAGSMETPAPKNSFIQRIGAGDLDGDGALDLVIFWGYGPWEGWINSCGPGATAADLDGEIPDGG